MPMTEMAGEPTWWLSIHFLRPLWFLALAPLPWVLWRLGRLTPGAEAWRGLIDAHLLRHLLVEEPGRARPLPRIFLALGWLLGVTALAGPAWERLPQPLYEAQAQRVIVLDLSPDMDAQDLPPSRLARARFEVLDLLAAATEGQTALLACGAEPFVVAPLTRDAATLAAQVPDLETALLPVKGPKRTDLALAEAGALLERAGSREADIILITADPGATEAPLREVARLHDLGYRTSVLGLGTEKGAPVPLAGGGFQTDDQGGIRLTRLRPDLLRELASRGGGRYVSLAADEADTRALLPEGHPEAAREELTQVVGADQWREEGPWLLLALLPLGALAFRRGWLSPLVLLVTLLGGLSPPAAQALTWEDLWWRADQQGARSLAAGDARQAAERFQSPDWRAAAHYDAGDYVQALVGLKDQTGPEAAYNRGNALARAGKLEEAIAEYDQALAAAPEHADARFNRELIQKLLDQSASKTGPGTSSPSSSTSPSPSSPSSSPSSSDSSSSPSSPASQLRAGQPGEGLEDQASQAGQYGPDQAGQAGQGQHEPRGPRGDGQQDAGGPDDPGGRDASPDAAKGRKEQAGQAGQPGEGREDQGSQAGQGQDQAGQTRQGRKDQNGPTGEGQQDAGGQVNPPEAGQGQAQSPAPAGQQPPAPEQAGQAGIRQDPADQVQSPGSQESGPGREPGQQDLLGSPSSASLSNPNPNPNPELGQQAPREAPVPLTEDQQAMEQQLRRVPDDPGGLLRQRFLLQHLRRQGQLP